MIINTRPHKQARKLSYKLEALNIEHTSFPLSDIKQRKNLTSADIEILKDIHTFDGIAFTSAGSKVRDKNCSRFYLSRRM